MNLKMISQHSKTFNLYQLVYHCLYFSFVDLTAPAHIKNSCLNGPERVNSNFSTII